MTALRPPSRKATAAGAAAPLASAAFARAYVVTMRPYLLFVSGIAGLAGLAFAPRLPLGLTLGLAVVFFLSYGFGQALTDCFQTDTDTLSAPYRPLVRGRVRRRDVLLVSLAGLGASFVVVAHFSPAALGLAALATLGLVSYTPFKRRWWGGPWYNAWIVAVLFLIGVVSGLRGEALRWIPALVATLAAVFFGYANFVLTGYFKDIAADRATDYRTLPVVFGRRRAALVSDVLAALQLVAGGAALAPAYRAVALPFAVAGAAFAIAAQVRLHAVRSDAEAHRAITPVVHAFILLLAAIATAQRPAWAPVLAGFYAAFVLVLRARPMPEQV